MPEPRTVTLRGLDGKDVEVSLGLPPSLARRWAVVALAVHAPVAAACAALGLCWRYPHGAAPKVPWAADPGAYGEAVGDALLARGVPFDGLMEAATPALVYVGASLGGLADQEVSAAEGFTGAPRGA